MQGSARKDVVFGQRGCILSPYQGQNGNPGLLTLGELGVPSFLRYEVFAVESFTQFAAFHNFGAATAAAVPLVLITLLVLFAEWRFFGSKPAFSI